MIRRTTRPNVRKAILEAHDYVCHYCGKDATEIDHIQSVKHGGDDSFTNLIATCTSCNQSKNTHILPEDKMQAAIAAAQQVAIILEEKFPDYDGTVHYTPSDTIPKTIGLHIDMWNAVSEYRHVSRIPTVAEALRQLVKAGLDAKRGHRRRILNWNTTTDE